MARTLTILQTLSSNEMNRWTHGVLRLSRALQLRGHRVMLACRKGTPAGAKAREMNIRVFEDMAFPGSFPRRDFWRECRLMARRTDIEIIDAIHAHGSHDSWIASVGSRLATRNPAVVRSVTTPLKGGPDPFNRMLHQGLAEHLVIPSGSVYEDFRTAPDFDQKMVSVIYYGVDLKKFNPSVSGQRVREEFGVQNDEPLIVWAGKPGASKGEAIVFKALAELSASNPKVRALLACKTDNDGHVEGLRRQAEEEGIAGIVRLTQNRSDIAQILAAADVIVVPAMVPQSASQVALEGAALGKPLVVSKVSGVAEFVQDGVTGAVVPPDDPSAVANALRTIVSDLGEAKRTGLSGRLYVEQEFSEDRMAERMGDLYLRILETRGGADGYRD